MHVTNRSTADQAFNLKGGDRWILAPGESANLALADPDSPQNKGRAHAGTVLFGKPKETEAAERVVERAAVKKD